MKYQITNKASFTIAATLLAADQLLKYFAYTNQSYTKYLVKPHLGWEYLGNTGIAFSLPIPNLVLILVSPLIIFALAILLTKNLNQNKVVLALTLIIFGATSNYIDRVFFALTIDYIRVWTSVFNLADIMIVTGALLLIKNKQFK